MRLGNSLLSLNEILNKDSTQPIADLGVSIKLAKVFGNKLLIISLDEASKPTLAVFDTEQSEYLLQKELIEKKGK